MEAHATLNPVSTPQTAPATLQCKPAAAQLRRLRIAGCYKRSTLPVLECVSLEPRDGRLWARGTDLDCMAAIELDCDASSWPASTCVNVRSLSDAIGTDGAATLSLTAAGRVAVHRESGADLTLATMPAEDFPPMPELGTLIGSVAAETLAETAKHAAIAASQDETRPELMGVLLEAEAGVFRFVATNDNRLHSLDMPALTLEPGTDAQAVGLIPARFVAGLARAKTLRPGPVRIYRNGKSFLTLAQSDGVFSVILAEGPFPQYRCVIPRKPAPRLAADSLQLLKLLESADKVADEQTRQVRIYSTGAGCCIMAERQGRGEFLAPIPCDDLSQDPDWCAGFNAGYLIDAVKMLAPGRIVLAMDSSTNAAMIRRDDDPTARYALVMPLRLPDTK